MILYATRGRPVPARYTQVMKWALALVTAFAYGQGTAPRSGITDYPAHIDLKDGFSLGAEYLVHSIPSPNGFYVLDGYLVVEVGLYGAKYAHMNISADQFLLRVSGSKAPIEPDPAGIIASGYTIWRMPGTPQSGGADDQMTIEDRIKHAALPEGDVKTPFAGLLYFPFGGKTKSIKTLELLYNGPEGKMALNLLTSN